MTFTQFAAASVCLAACSVACATCSPAFTEQWTGAERIAGSLRPDKPGQMRVYAYDGSEYTAGEAMWMKGQLRASLRACARADEALAESLLERVTNLQRSHHRAH